MEYMRQGSRASAPQEKYMTAISPNDKEKQREKEMDKR